MSKDLLPSLRKVNAIWHQKAWGYPDCPFTEKPRIVAVTLATESYINRCSLTASNVPAHNWKKRGKYCLSEVSWLSLDYMLKLYCHPCGKAVMDNSLRDWDSFQLTHITAHTVPWVSMVIILGVIKAYLVPASDQTVSSKISSQFYKFPRMYKTQLPP